MPGLYKKHTATQPTMPEMRLEPLNICLTDRPTGFFSSSGASSTGDRCSITRLAGEVNVHFSTVSPAQQSHSEVQDHSGGRGYTHRPLVAITTVVSKSATPVCGPPTILSVLLRPATKELISNFTQNLDLETIFKPFDLEG